MTLCDEYNELNDLTTRDRPILNNLSDSDKRLQNFKCEENDSATEIYPFINDNLTTFDLPNICNCYNNRDIVYYLTVRQITRNYKNDNLFMSNSPVFYMQNSLIELINFKWNSDNYYLRLKWFYLGEYLTKNIYSPLVYVPTAKMTGKMTKCTLLILMLLFMCGDTGISTNPGPIGQRDLNICEVSDDRYLNIIDPDMNYFNETELNSSYYKSYTIDEFKERTFNSQLNFNILHHNCRSILSKDKIDQYDDFLALLGNPFDIIGLTETWLNVNTANSPIFTDYNYNHVYETRPLDKKFRMQE